MIDTKLVKLIIDGAEVEVPAGSTVFQACEINGFEIPHFCYHPRLKIAGNCRMCLVEIEGSPKPIASCAMPVSESMIVHTHSPMVDKARQGVMEFLLINHPLDCPICDQGGECDLQDQAVAYGRCSSRFDQEKRAVPQKHMGPLIKTFMNRCIHCTRCIRFAEDVAGIPELGAIGRGEDTEIITYMDKPFSSEMSGNVVDLCPVGALTSRPYAFKGRPWELRKTETIDVMDAVGSHIRVDTHGQVVRRVLPRLNEDINEEWISDKTRHACDGLRQQRLDRPFIRKSGKLVPVSWTEAFDAIKKHIKKTEPLRIGAIAGNMVDVETLMAAKDLLNALGSSNYDCRDGEYLDHTDRSKYIFNTSIAGIEESDLCLLIGTHPRFEAPIINARIRKHYSNGGFTVYRIGQAPKNLAQDLTYPVKELGHSPKILETLLNGTHAFVKQLEKAKKPMLILGMDALKRNDGEAISSTAAALAEKYMITAGWNGFNILHQTAARVGGLDIGFVPGTDALDTNQMLKEDALDVLYLLGADEIDLSRVSKKTFVIYQGHHGDKGAQRADAILPGHAYTEKNATYVNTEGRVQRAYRACQAPGDAKEDWKILRALSDVLECTLPYDNIIVLRQRMAEVNPVFAIIDFLQPKPWKAVDIQGNIMDAPLSPWSGSFYMTDPISRHSATMAQCRRTFEEPLES